MHVIDIYLISICTAQETGQIPMLPEEEREAGQIWLTVRYCTAALATQAQRAAAAERSGDDPICLAVAQTLLPLLEAPFCWVRHFAAHGFLNLARSQSLRKHGARFVPALVKASADTSAVPDKNAAAPATQALARLRGGGGGGQPQLAGDSSPAAVGRVASEVVEELVMGRFTGR